MNTVTLLQPPRTVFGNGCASGSVEWLSQRGIRRLLLVTSPSVLPQLAALISSIETAGCRVVLSPLIGCEPTTRMFEEALGVAQAEQVEAVLGIGGGSPLDVAKLVAGLAGGDQTVHETFGINLLHSRRLALICLPTTAGTGSEVSPNAVLLDETQMKRAAISPYLVPDAAFIDPLLTVAVPPAVTAATGLDALTHCIEAFANKFAHPIVDLHALEGVRLISSSLLCAVRNGKDIQARENLALGSLYGGFCLGPVNTAAVHALAYPLGGRFHISHGVSNAMLLPEVLRFNLPHAPEIYERVAVALGVEKNGSALGTAERGVEVVAELSRACGVPQRLSDLAIPRAALPEMAKSAMQVTRLLKNNLRPVTEPDAMRIYEAVY